MTHTRRRPLSLLLLAAHVLVSFCMTVAQQQAAAHQDQSRKTSTPYTGDLTIFDSPGREQRLHIEKVMDVLSIGTGKNVADIGAGSGWFTVRAAHRVTNTGMVFAVDINPEAVHYIDKRAVTENLHNIKTILGTPSDPKLPANDIDSVLLLKTYHEIADPIGLLRNLRASLKPHARIGIIDRNGNGENHGVEKKVVLEEATRAGYRLVDEQDDLVRDDKMDYFLIFEAR